MFGIMGTSAAFAQAACAKKQENKTILRFENADPTIGLSCTGEITVESIKNGESIKHTYSNLSEVEVSVEADVNSDIVIIGDVTKIFADEIGLVFIDVSKNATLAKLEIPNNPIVSLDLSKNTALTNLQCNDTQLASLDVSKNIALKQLDCSYTQLASLDLSKNIALTNLQCLCEELLEIKCTPNSSNVANAIAGAIANANADSGTVYTDSAGAYYSTIATAATTKGWTIQQLS